MTTTQSAFETPADAVERWFNDVPPGLSASNGVHELLWLLYLRGTCDSETWAGIVDSAGTRGAHGLMHFVSLVVEHARTLEPQLQDVLPQAFNNVYASDLDVLVLSADDCPVAVSDDVLGRLYEYSVQATPSQRASGSHYTPTSVVDVLVGLLEPYEGTIYDPCCGTGALLVRSRELVSRRTGGGDVVYYGQEVQRLARDIAKLTLSALNIKADLGVRATDTLSSDVHPDVRADFVLVNPPFNSGAYVSHVADDPRWAYGPPLGNATKFAWLQHAVYHAKPTGVVGIVMPMSSLSSLSPVEQLIRRRLVEADVVDCVVTLRAGLFNGTPIPVCLWVLTKTARSRRRGDVLFIDARDIGCKVSRTRWTLTPDQVTKVTSAYRAWVTGHEGYTDEVGFCAAVAQGDVADRNFDLRPRAYVGSVAPDTGTTPDDLRQLADDWRSCVAEGRALDVRINDALERLGY